MSHNNDDNDTGVDQKHDAQPPSSEQVLRELAENLSLSTISTLQEPLYEYTPLPDSNSFRLLTIHPAEPTAPLTLSLTPVHFTDKLPAYEALSYVWGLEPGYRTATCNGRLLERVTTNLYEALERLRGREGRVVWVDALCIRQDNEAERSQQVKKMHHIYARAQRVVVWLGRDDGGDAEGAFGVLCALANTDNTPSTEADGNGTQGKVPAVYESTEDGGEVMETGLQSVPSFSNGALWKSVHAFFQNKWFLRMWVLQEIVLARTATVVWGSCSISWDTIDAGIHAIRADQTLHSLLESRALQNAFFMQHLRTLHCSNEDTKVDGEGKKHPFLHLLDIARSFDVTEPRDKVYGLLGFPTRDASLETRVFVVPDYTLSVADVYTDVARKVMEKDGDLNVLSFVVHRNDGGEEGRDMPSWVPDWTCKDITYPFMGFREENRHHAGTTRKTQIVDGGNAKVLCLKGVVVDTVHDVGPRIPFSDFHASESVLKELVEWCMRGDVEVGTLATTLTAGRDSSGHIIADPAQHIADFVALLQELGIGLATALFDRGQSKLARREGETGRAKEAAWRYSCYRAPFRTEKGGLGLGPGGMRVGDKVVVLWGGQVPFVLREVGGESGVWRFVGEAYVEGVMDGEVEGSVDGGTCMERVFEIR